MNGSLKDVLSSLFWGANRPWCKTAELQGSKIRNMKLQQLQSRHCESTLFAVTKVTNSGRRAKLHQCRSFVMALFSSQRHWCNRYITNVTESFVCMTCPLSLPLPLSSLVAPDSQHEGQTWSLKGHVVRCFWMKKHPHHLANASILRNDFI